MSGAEGRGGGAGGLSTLEGMEGYFAGESLLGIFEIGGTSPGSAGGDGSESLLAYLSGLERPDGPARELVPVTLLGQAGAAVIPSVMSGSLVFM